MVALPGLIALTSPDFETVAIDELEDFQVIFFFVPVIFNLILSPTERVFFL